MLMHVKVRKCSLWQEVELLLQRGEGQIAWVQTPLQIVGHSGFFILSRRDIQGFYHQATSFLPVYLVTQGLPEAAPGVIRQQLLLPGAVEKGSGLAPEAINPMAVVDAPGTAGFG